MGADFDVEMRLTRRRLLRVGAALPAAGAVAALWPTRAMPLPPTPACGKDAHPTPRSSEGPYYTPRSPLRGSFLEPGFKGERIILAGRVVTRRCRPVAGAIVDLWHADGIGEYDNRGFRGRGHQVTDADGRYRFLTVVPGDYPGRTRHYHVKLVAPDRPPLTTQLYFPEVAGNARDFLFKPELLLKIDNNADDRVARFDFVLDIA